MLYRERGHSLSGCYLSNIVSSINIVPVFYYLEGISLAVNQLFRNNGVNSNGTGGWS